MAENESEREARELAEMESATKRLTAQREAQDARNELELQRVIDDNARTSDREYRVRLKIGILLGSDWQPPGRTVKLPEIRARRLCLEGSATPADVIALLALPAARKPVPEVPRPKLTEPAPDRTRQVEVIVPEGRSYYHARSGQSFGRGSRLFLDEIEASEGCKLGILATADSKPAARTRAIAQQPV